MPNTQDDVIIVGQLQDDKLRKAVTDLVNFVKTESDSMAGHFQGSLDKMQEAMKKFAVNQKAAVSLMKEAMQQYGLMFEEIWKQTEGKDKEPKKYAPNTIGELEQEIALREKNRKNMELDSEELKRQNRLIEVQKQALADQKGLNTRAALIKKAKDDLKDAFSAPANSLEQVEKKLAKLQSVASRYRSMPGILDNSQWNRLNNQIDRAREKVEKFKMAMPKMKDIKGMSEKSVADVAKKLQALRNVQVDPKNTTQVRKLGDEYQRLTRLQNELLGRGIQLTKSNNYLAQSFGYIRNRIVYAMTLGAATSFVKNVYEIRSQYELLERSLGVLLGSFERGTQIFNELNTMALKSPFTLMELGTAAKQLTAYNFKAEEVVNTTKRLADISAALGVPMERLTYNLGQIRAQTVLTARDARDFANAGLPIVKSLADYFSELEGRVVSTGDVFERMSKKQVTYNDVMAVLNQMTDEGGKFFDFQAKQAETLRVQLANLTLAWNNMLNEVGEANQGLLTAPIEGLKALFANWREISHVITEVVVALGIYKGTQILINKLMGESATVMKSSILLDKEKKASALEMEGTVRKLTKTELKQIANKKQIVAADYKAILSTRELSKTQALLLAAYNRNNKELLKALVQLKLLKKAEVENITVGKAWSIVLKQIELSLKSLGTTIMMFAKQAAIMVAIGAIVEAISTWSEISDKIKDINKSITDSAKESAESIGKFLDDYKETYKKVAEIQEAAKKQGSASPDSTSKGGTQPQKLSDEEAEKAWVAIKEQIQLSSAASDVFIQKLMAIKDMNERINAGFGYLERIHDVNGALETLGEKAIDIAGDWSKWWNLWTLPDGLIGNLKDYTDYLDKMAEKWGSINNLIEANRQKVEGAEGDYHDMEAQLSTFKDNLRDTTESMYNSFTSVGITGAEDMREAMERSNQQILQDANLTSKEQLHYRMQAEKDFIDYKMGLFTDEYNFEKERGNTERAERVRQEALAWKEAFGEGQAVSDEFFKWLKNQHASEINKLFGNMSRRELEHLDWSNPKWQKWAMDNAESFSKQYGVAFDQLKSLVNDANRWQIFLKLTITTDEKGVYDTLKDADAAANAAWTKIQRLKQRQAELNKIPAKSLTDEQQEEAKNLLTELTQAQNDYNDALAKGGHASKQSKAAAKARKTAEQEISEALKEELAIIKDMQSNYEKLTKAGVDSMTALDASTQGYEATLEKVNKTLSKYGISKFNAKDFVGKDVNDLLAKLEKQRKDVLASGNAKTSSIEALDLKIKEVRVEAQTYNMKKVTEGLNNELNKVKEEYEIGIEFDANPELGNIFADMMGIDREELDALPRSYDEVVQKLQNSINRLFAENHIEKQFDLTKMLDKGDFDRWVEAQGNVLTDDFAKALNSIREYANKVRLDEAKDTTKEWNDLVNKYGTLQGKLVKIAKDTAKQQLAIIKKFGNDKEKLDAADLTRRLNISQDPEEVARLQKQLAELMARVVAGNPQATEVATSVNNEGESLTGKAYWDDFKDSSLYAMTFEDMSRNSTMAIQLIIDKLEELQDKVKEDPASMKALSTALQDARKELEGRSSTLTIVSALNQIKEASKEVTDAKKELADANIDLADAENQFKSAEASGDTTAIAKATERLVAARKRQKEAAENAAAAENKFRAGVVKLRTGLEVLGGELQNIQGLFGVVSKLFRAAGMDDTADAIDAISEGFSIMTTVIMGVVAAMVILESTVPWLLAVAAALSVVVGLVSWLSGSDNKKIDKQVKESEVAVKRLENSYKNLERAVESAYGAMQIGARKAAIANKELQLVELRRQLQLERSRDSKDRDASKIADLEGRIIDLKNEIQDMKDAITNSFLGLSSVGDAVNSMMDDIVDALRNGEDAMLKFDESIDDMIANMIKQVFSARILGPMLEKIWDRIDKDIQSRGEAWADQVAGFQAMYDHIENTNGGEGYWFYKMGNTWGYTNNYWNAMALKMQEGVEMMTYDAWMAAIKKIIDDSQDALDAATTPTMDDVRKYGNELRMVSPELQAYIGELENILREMGLIKDATSEEALSKLQQGIQGVTEDTAGAIEAYMNIIAQRVFEQNQYLMDIRDAIVLDGSVAQLDAMKQLKESVDGIDSDSQLGTLSLMLLQLQQSYQVQSSILALLNRWDNPAGTAIKVEMV